jgi:hypothetical protein
MRRSIAILLVIVAISIRVCSGIQTGSQIYTSVVKEPRRIELQIPAKSKSKPKPLHAPWSRPTESHESLPARTHIGSNQASNAPTWSLCDILQGFLTWRFAQSQPLILGLFAFLFNLFIPILGPQNRTSYLYGWISCGFIEGFFGDGDVEGDSGISIDILATAILWGCLKSFRLARARDINARTLANAKKKMNMANKRLINAPALVRLPAKLLVRSPPLSILYKFAAESDLC